jgi:Pumilio-family RNA binding repeat
LKLLRALKKDFIEVSCSKVGTHSMQRLVEVLCHIDEKKLVYESILDKLHPLAFDPKGNYVLTAIMGVLKNPDTLDMLSNIIDLLIPIIPQLIKDQLGICVVNKIIQTATEQRHISYLIDYLIKNIFEIIYDPYGNYAITTALDVIIRTID